MADDKSSYVINPKGIVEAHPPDEADMLLGVDGYMPAGADQVEKFKAEQALKEKYTTVPQKALTAIESALSAGTFGFTSAIESAAGHEEGQKYREKFNPWERTGGTVVGAFLPAFLTAGSTSAISAAEEGVAAAKAAGTGIEAAEEALSAAKAAAAANPASWTAPALISRAGEAAAGAVKEAIGPTTTGLGRIASKGAQAAASGGVEGLLWGSGQVVHEASLGDPDLTASHIAEEIGLSGLLGGGIGFTGGALSGLIGEAAGSELGEKAMNWAQNVEGNANAKAAGSNQKIMTRELEKLGPNQDLARKEWNKRWQEAGEMNLVGKLTGAGESAQRSAQALGELGPKIGDMTESAGEAGARNVQDVFGKIEDSLKGLEDDPFKIAAAKRVAGLMDDWRSKLGGEVGENDVSLANLHKFRRSIDDELYGVSGDKAPGANYYSKALHDVRHIVSDEIDNGMESIGADKLAGWKDLNRKYSIAAMVNRVSNRGMNRNIGNNLFPATTVLGGLAGLIHGGPLGALAVGALSYGAKRFGPNLVGAGARALRNAIDEGAAEGLASKTAEAIAAARQAGTEVRESNAAKLASAWARAADKLDTPVGAPVKDLVRDDIQEKLASKEGTQMETVAALSQIAAANNRANERIGGLAKSLVTGSISKHLAAPAAAMTADEYMKTQDKVHHLAESPAAMLEHVNATTSDIQEHAPNIAQAYAAMAGRAVSHMHNKFPGAPRATPMSKPMKPSKTELFRHGRTMDVIIKPTNLLKRAANGTMTRFELEAVAAVHPALLDNMRKSVLEEMSQNENSMPHRSKLMASMLLGQPMDGSLTQGAIASNQAIYSLPSAKGPDNQTGPAAMGKTTQKGLGKLNMSNQSMLPGRAAETRRGEA